MVKGGGDFDSWLAEKRRGWGVVLDMEVQMIFPIAAGEKRAF